MAAFTPLDPSDRVAFAARFARLRDDADHTRAVDVDHVLARMVATYAADRERQVTCWIDRFRWGQGVAKQALAAMTELDPHQPLHGRAAPTDVSSIGVLLFVGFVGFVGFVEVGQDEAYANGVGAEVKELVFRLT